MKFKNLRVKIRIKGAEPCYLINALQAKNINVYYVKEVKNGVEITVDYADKHKIFAICKNMCYNNVIIGYRGLLSLVVYSLKYLGVIIGILAFIVISVITDGIVLKVSFEGSGASVLTQSNSILLKNGVTVGSWFKDIDFNLIENKLLKENKSLSFVTLKKRGNVLIVDGVLSEGYTNSNVKQYSNVVSEVDGVIESVNVLRGTCNLKVGDKVSKNDVLINAYMVGKDENTYPTFIIGTVAVVYEKQVFFKTQFVSNEFISSSVAYAKFMEEDEIIECTHSETEGGIIVKLKLKKVHSGG